MIDIGIMLATACNDFLQDLPLVQIHLFTPCATPAAKEKSLDKLWRNKSYLELRGKSCTFFIICKHASMVLCNGIFQRNRCSSGSTWLKLDYLLWERMPRTVGVQQHCILGATLYSTSFCSSLEIKAQLLLHAPDLQRMKQKTCHFIHSVPEHRKNKWGQQHCSIRQKRRQWMITTWFIKSFMPGIVATVHEQTESPTLWCPLSRPSTCHWCTVPPAPG